MLLQKNKSTAMIEKEICLKTEFCRLKERPPDKVNKVSQDIKFSIKNIVRRVRFVPSGPKSVIFLVFIL
jgi:hypothetical protein